MEEKIGLERLASLGQAAATIAQLMREDPALARSHGEDLAFIAGEADRLDGSVRQLLGFARQKPPLDEEVDLSALLESAAAAVTRQTEKDGVGVSAQAEPGIVALGRG
ncbi:MAG: hypothetical protein HY235_11450 [Acidobacteria bacterium]|nr:hypothetical protein [Acidobacteriota bacterium]